MDSLFPALIFLMIVMLISRILSEKALKALSSEEKVRLIDAFSSQRTWSLAIVIVIFTGYYLLTRSDLLGSELSLVMYFVALIALLSTQYQKAKEKMKAIEISGDYIREYNKIFLIKSLGLIAFVILTFWRIL